MHSVYFFVVLADARGDVGMDAAFRAYVLVKLQAEGVVAEREGGQACVNAMAAAMN